MDWMTQLAQYVPQTPQEAADKVALQNDVQKYGTAVLERSSPSGSHICCSGMILDPTMTQVLLVYHNIYQSFSWTGGHADGESDFLAVAIREAQEETGLQQVQPLCSAILSIDRLPVKAHIRRGEPVAAHFHDCISFGLLADPKQPLRIQPAENSAVCWKPIAELPELVKVYRDALKIADAYPDSLGARILRESLSIGEPEAILNTEQTLRELQEWLIRKSDPC